MIVLAVSMVLITFALVGVDQAQARVRLADGARGMSNYLEKARTDSIRRHADSASQGSVQITSSTTYRIRYDQNSDNTLDSTEFLDVTLPSGVTFVMSPTPTTASYDWRGQVTSAITYTLQNTTGTTTISITKSGDVTLSSTAIVPTTASSSTPYPTPSSTPTATATPTPTPVNLAGCSIVPSPTSISVRKSGKSSQNIYVSGSAYGNSDTVTVTIPSDTTTGLPLLKVTLSPSGTAISSGYTFTASATTLTTFNVIDLKGSNSNYTTTISFTPTICDPSDVTVNVTPN